MGDDRAQGRRRRWRPAARWWSSRRPPRRCRRWRWPSWRERAGVPPGVLNVVCGPAEEVGAELADRPAVRKLTFTGSTAVGKLLMAQARRHVKRVVARARRQRAVHRVRRRRPRRRGRRGRSRRSSATPARPASARTGSSCRTASTTPSSSGSCSRRPRCGSATASTPGVELGPLIDERAVAKVRRPHRRRAASAAPASRSAGGRTRSAARSSSRRC